MTTVRRKIKFHTERRRRQQEAKPPRKKGRVPRVARLMALAIRLEHLIQTGAVTDQAELARVGHVTRARLTQIMNLLQLAPDIQEEILFLPVTERGRDVVTERDLRSISSSLAWRQQRRFWRRLNLKTQS